MGIRSLLVCVLVAGTLAACASSPPPDEPLPAWKGTIVAHNKVTVDGGGTVGYVKTFRYSRPGYGRPYELYHVYDAEFVERGFVSERGTAVKYVQLPPQIAKVKGHELESEQLPAQPLAYNVAKILEVDETVRIEPVTAAEVAAPK
jgi:hypothetical protein